jgi:hypothetical protein
MKMNLPKMLDMFTTRAGLLPSLPERDRLFYHLTGTVKDDFPATETQEY